MKNVKKIVKGLLLLIIAVIGVTAFDTVDAATSAPSTITTAYGTQLSGYVAGTYFVQKVTTDGKYVYCTDIDLLTPHNMKMTLVGSQDAGITYIMKNGYPNKSFTGNSKYDYYITQTALWWYLDETTGSSNLTNSFKTTGSDKYGLRSYIKTLKTAAVKAKSSGYTKPSVTLSASGTDFTLSGDYYYSEYVTVKGTSTSGNITLSLSGAPSGSVLVNSSGTTVTKVSSGTKVRIKVPKSAVSSLSTTIKISASATGSVEKAYLYKPSSSKYQSVVMGVLYAETSSVSASKSFTLKSTQVSITKMSSDTNSELAGATLVLKDSSGTVVDTWTTTTSAHTIKNLPAGTYYLSETNAPSGYEVSTEVQEIVLTAGSLTKATFYNTKKEPTKVVVIKRDKDTNETLAGAVFSLKDEDGEEITTWTSTTNGHYVQGLPEGTYTIEEVSAPDGYVLSEEKYTVTLEAGKTVTVNVYNEKQPEEEIESILKILKIDGETGEKLAGATLVLKDASGKTLYTWTTTEDYYTIEDVEAGTYYLSETKAPSGYVLSEDVVEITVSEDGGTQYVTFYNTPEVEVPNTGSNMSVMAIVVGLIITSIGGVVVYKNVKKEV